MAIPAWQSQYATWLQSKGAPAAGGGGINTWMASQPGAFQQEAQQMRTALESGQTAYSGGVEPIGMVEPLTDWQKGALGSLASPVNTGYSQGMKDIFSRGLAQTPNATPYFNMAQDLIGKGTTPITVEQLTGATQRLQNPALSQMIDSVTGQIRRQGDRAMADTRAALPGGRNFGSSSAGARQGMVDEAVINSIADKTAGLNFDTWNTAQNTAGNLLTNNRSANLQGAQMAGGLGATALNGLRNLAGLATTGEDIRRRGVLDKLSAGEYVQNQNQKTLNLLRPEITGTTNYSRDNLAWLGKMLGQFNPSGTSSTAVSNGASTNPLQQISGLGLLASGLGMFGGSLSGGGGSNTLGGYSGSDRL